MTWDPSRFVAFDCETHLIQPGLIAPPLVCASVAGSGFPPQILDKVAARSMIAHLLAPSTGAIIVGANVAYDLLVMAVDAARRGEDLIADIFRAYDEGRVFDVQIAESLHAVAGGHLGKHPDGSPLKDAKGRITTRYSLDTCVRLVLGRDNAKVNDEWRLRYHELEHLPIAEWPHTARTYPVDDAVNTLEVAIAQVGGPNIMEKAGGAPRKNLHDLAAQCRAAWALHLGASWGFRVDGVALDALEKRVTETRETGAARWKALGLLREDGSQDLARTRRKVVAAYSGLAQTCPACQGRCGTCLGAHVVPGVRGVKKCPACKGTGAPQCDECQGIGCVIGAAVPRTDKGGIAYGRDALTESGDEDLMAFADWTEDAKIANVYVPYLREGVAAPLNLRPNTLLETGRASYSGVIQLLPREGGVRECIVSRPGTVLVSCDYGGLELATHAQSCLWLVGHSELAKALNGGIKVHDAMGARLGGISYDEILERNKRGDKQVKAWRQAAKAANFGFPGGMGGPKLVLQQRKQGPDTTAPDGTKYKGLRLCVLLRGATVCGERKITEWKERPLPPTCVACVECAEDLRKAWLDQWPENREYFRTPVNAAADRGWMEQHVSKRIRGGVTFTSAANGYFQGLAADGAKLALYRTSRECYVDRASALYGSRVILFAHDELILEVPEAQAHEAATRLSTVMVSAMREFVPDVVVTAEPALMRAWHKNAEPKYVDGRLVPWEPERKAA